MFWLPVHHQEPEKSWIRNENMTKRSIVPTSNDSPRWSSSVSTIIIITSVMFHFLNANRKGRTTEIRLGNPSNLYSADPISMQIQFNSIGYQVHIVGVKRGRIGKQKKNTFLHIFLLIQIQFPHMHSHVYLIPIQMCFFFWLKKMYVPNALSYAGLVLDENSKTFLPDGWHHVEYPPQFETHINRVFKREL